MSAIQILETALFVAIALAMLTATGWQMVAMRRESKEFDRKTEAWIRSMTAAKERVVWAPSSPASREAMRTALTEWKDCGAPTGFIIADQIQAGVIAPDSIMAAKLANDIKFPDWFKIYTPDELEAALGERRRLWESADPWPVRALRWAFRRCQAWWSR